MFALRESGDEHLLDGLPELMVEGLADPDARALLESAVPGPVDARVRRGILDETRGNPLALIELPRGLTPAELAGGFDARPLASRIEHTLLRRVQTLPRDTQLQLLTAVAEPAATCRCCGARVEVGERRLEDHPARAGKRVALVGRMGALVAHRVREGRKRNCFGVSSTVLFLLVGLPSMGEDGANLRVRTIRS